jgi:hypothetical protein
MALCSVVILFAAMVGEGAFATIVEATSSGFMLAVKDIQIDNSPQNDNKHLSSNDCLTLDCLNIPVDNVRGECLNIFIFGWQRNNMTPRSAIRVSSSIRNYNFGIEDGARVFGNIAFVFDKKGSEADLLDYRWRLAMIYEFEGVSNGRKRLADWLSERGFEFSIEKHIGPLYRWERVGSCLGCLSSNARKAGLAPRYEGQNDRECGDEDRRNGSNGPVVQINEIKDTAGKDQRALENGHTAGIWLILLGPLIAVVWAAYLIIKK